MIFKFNRNLYSKEAMLKAAYRFTDKAYIHLDIEDEYFIVNISLKNNNTAINKNDFKNEILAQMVRLNIGNRTKNIRELIIARALSSTIIDNENDAQIEEYDANIEEILKDWFDGDE